MPSPVATLQVAQPTMGTVSRRPQTTGQPAVPGSVPFTRLSRKGQILGPAVAGLAYGSLWTPTLRPVGGYLRSLNINITSVTGGGGAAGAPADNPWNVIQNLFLRDPFGQPLVQADGYSLFLINIYSGTQGMLSFGNNPTTVPSYTAPVVGAATFRITLAIPLEMDSSAYCSLSTMNAAAQPQLQINFNPALTAWTGPIAVADPTLSVTVNEPYWMAPVDNPQIAPPDVGSSAQWSVATSPNGVQSAAYQRIVLPRVGTFIHTLILVLRDATGARVASWPATDLQFWIDGVPVVMETLIERQDKMWRQFGVAAPVGVVVYTFRDSIQTAVSTGDTYDILLPSTPATSLEVGGTFGVIAAAPATVQAVTGELFPVGGIPYTHLAQ